MNRDNKYGKILTIVLIVIIVAIIGVLVYLGISAMKDNKTKDTYTKAAEDFEESVKGSSSRSKGSNSTLNVIDPPSSGNSKKYLENYEIIGTIQIPKVDLKCVILKETTKRALEIAVAQIYTTSSLNQPGNTVIYGHNYRNDLFFSRNDELATGDKVYITDQEGTKLTYEIFNIFETTSSDTSFYPRTAQDTEGKAEVTLSTCTDDAATTDRRLIVQARAID